jgi:ATP-dependent RNA helicase DDX18/HAS1
VAWSIHLDIPSDVQHLIRVWGRAKKEGEPKFLLILAHFEEEFAKMFQKSGLEVSQFTFPESKLAPISDKLARLVTENYNYAVESREAYRSFVHFYYGHSFSQIFDANKLELKKVAASFGLAVLPKLSMGEVKTKQPNIFKKHHRKTVTGDLKELGESNLQFEEAD